jgi:hypothetical protein
VGRFHVVDDKLVEIPEPLSPFEIKRRERQAELDKLPRQPFTILDDTATHMSALLEGFIQRNPGLLSEIAADTDRLIVKLRVALFVPEGYAHILKRLKIELNIAKDMTDLRSRNLMVVLAHVKAHEDLQDRIYTLRDYRGPEPGPKPTYRQYLRQLDARLQEAECPPDLQEADETTEPEIQQEQGNG